MSGEDTDEDKKGNSGREYEYRQSLKTDGRETSSDKRTQKVAEVEERKSTKHPLLLTVYNPKLSLPHFLSQKKTDKPQTHTSHLL